MNKLAGLLGVLAIVAVTPLARADFQISINGTTNCTPTVGTNPQPSASPTGSLTCAAVTVAPGVTIQDVAVTGQQAADFSQQLGHYALDSKHNLISGQYIHSLCRFEFYIAHHSARHH